MTPARERKRERARVAGHTAPEKPLPRLFLGFAVFATASDEYRGKV
jgi:hypothetical protein